MSRTIRFHKFGPAEVLKCEEHAAAQPAPGEVQVRVEAIGISWYDILWRQNLASSHARLPSGLGHEMAGVVVALGEGVDDLAVGDKVASFPAESPNDYPVYGELIVLPRSALTRYPDVLSPIEASVHYTPLLIAYFAYMDLARVKPGQFALVTEEQDLLMQINKYTDNRGVDVVFDGLGGPQMSLLGDVLAPRGSLVLYGLQGGNQTPFPACAAFQKNIQFFVHCIGNFTGKPELGIIQDHVALQRALRDINQLTADRVLVPLKTTVFAFNQFVEAHRYMDECPCRERVALQVEAV